MVQKSKAYIDDLMGISDPPDTNNCQSEVSKYYAGRNILVTGGSGFLGILLIERLLRCCPGLRKMYVFMKGKKGKSAEDRFKEQFDSFIYDRLKKEQPDFITKVIMIEANIGEANMGLSLENRKRLLDTNIIFHMAAAVRFNEILRDAVNINVKGTKEILLFAEEMTNLKAFVYVSTAFSHCVHKFIDEKYYPPPLNIDKILALLDILNNEKLEEITPILLGKWPNTYIYSKAIAEDVVRQHSVKLPVCIVRPSIIHATSKEPIVGWCNMHGVVGVILGSGLGLIRTIYCMPENNAEVVPADYVIANIIVAGWDTAKRKDAVSSVDKGNVSESERAPIYNYVSSTQNPLTWKMFMKLNKLHGLRVPSMNMMWYYIMFLNKYRFMHNICVLFLHMIPAVIVDGLAVIFGRKPMLLNIYKKANAFTDMTAFFSMGEWQFRNDAVMELWNRLNAADREIFDFSIHDMCWDDFMKRTILGLRLYIAKDPQDTIQQARVKYKKLAIAHYTLVTVISILLIWGIVSLINFINF